MQGRQRAHYVPTIGQEPGLGIPIGFFSCEESMTTGCRIDCGGV